MEASRSEGVASGGDPLPRRPERAAEPAIGPAGAQGGDPSYLGQLAAVVWKDLIVELRSRQRLVAMAAFTVLVGILFNYALGQAVTDLGDQILPRNVAAALIWMTLVFAAMLGVGRTFQLEAEDGAFQGLLTSPIPKDAIYLAKVLSNFTLVMLIVSLLMGVFGLFFGLDYGGQPLAISAVVALGALGFVGLSTLFAAVSSATSMGETLLPVLLFPLLVPMIVFGAGATGDLLAGRPFSAVDGSVKMLGAFTLISLLAGTLLFRYVVEE
jgi:heme exporter protein B